MNTDIIDWAHQLQTVLFHDRWASGAVSAQDDGSVQITVENRPTAILGPKKGTLDILATGNWYNWEVEDFFLCVRFREFLKKNPFPGN